MWTKLDLNKMQLLRRLGFEVVGGWVAVGDVKHKCVGRA